MVTVSRRSIQRIPVAGCLVINRPDIKWSAWRKLAEFETPGQRIGLSTRRYKYSAQSGHYPTGRRCRGRKPWVKNQIRFKPDWLSDRPWRSPRAYCMSCGKRGRFEECNACILASLASLAS